VNEDLARIITALKVAMGELASIVAHIEDFVDADVNALDLADLDALIEHVFAHFDVAHHTGVDAARLFEALVSGPIPAAPVVANPLLDVTEDEVDAAIAALEEHANTGDEDPFGYNPGDGPWV
jgi:hypothetical protein